MDFAFNRTNITRQVRRRWIDLFADYGARIEIAYLEPELARRAGTDSRKDDRTKLELGKILIWEARQTRRA